MADHSATEPPAAAPARDALPSPVAGDPSTEAARR